MWKIILLLPALAFANTTLFFNGQIHSRSRLNQPDANWMVVKEGKILKLGKETPPPQSFSSKVDLKGRTIFPALTDGHAHILDIGKSRYEVNLRGTASESEAANKVKEYLAKNNLIGTKTVLGNDWDQSDWPKKNFPTRSSLDAITESQPLILYRVDGHAAWVNTYALKKAGIWSLKTDPAGGKIHRDAEGNPTGVLIDSAMDLLSSLISPPSLEDSQKYLTLAVNHALSLGITSIHDAGASDTTLKAIQNLLKEKKVKFRFYEMLSSSDLATLKKHLKSRPSAPLYDNQFEVRAVKLYIDGAMGSRGALFSSPYQDDPSTSGVQMYKQEELYKLVKDIHSAHYQIAVHAIGTLGNKLVLDAYEHLKDKNISSSRHRLEHAQVLELKDIERAGRLGIIASMQPTHCTSDMKWVVDRIGKERARYSYAWRSMLDHKVPLAFGSDAPVEDLNPWPGLFAAITRQNTKFEPKEGFYPEEKLTLAESFEAFTEGAAFASFHEADRGKLTPGYAADFILLKQNPYDIKPIELYRTQVEATYVGGEKAYELEETPRS